MNNLCKLLAAFSVLIIMNSCSGDDPANELEGTWHAIEFSADVNSSTEVNGVAFESSTRVEGSNFEYEVVFTSDAFTTSGSYDVETSGMSSGVVIPATTSSYTNVMGTGSYTTDGNTITISGSFFSVEFNGAPVTGIGEMQTANYEINSNNQLIFSQNETLETNTGGVTSTTSIISSSVWEKQ